MDLKSNEPFWLVKNGIITSYPSLHHDENCDVLIVGGGITGSLMAHQCVKDGYKTILIDKREIANGSSSATTSMLQYEIDFPLTDLIAKIGKKGAIASYKACSKAIDTLEQLCIDIHSEAGFKSKESLYFAAYKKDTDALKKEFETRKEAGFEVQWLEEKEIKSKYKLEHAFGGILSKQGASVDAFRLVHEILDYNIKKGLQVYDKTALTKVKYGQQTNEVSLSTGATIKAKKIVYCVGYESAQMIKEQFVNLISTFAIVSEINPDLNEAFKETLFWNTANPYIYLRSTDDGRMLIGGEDEPFINPQKRDDFIPLKRRKLVKSFTQHFPKTIFYDDFAWAGTFGETKDGLPYIGEHPDFNHSYFVLGFGGNGITFSVTGMEMLSHWLQGKTHPLSEWFQFGR